MPEWRFGAVLGEVYIVPATLRSESGVGGESGLGSRTSNFRYSFLFLPRDKRQAIQSVYAFARRGDDVVDGDLTPEAAAYQLALHREALDRCYSQPDQPEGGSGLSGLPQNARAEFRALADSIRRYSIPRQHFDDLILGFEMDLRGTCYRTFDDLAVYCYRVAATIGLIAIQIFGYRNPRTREYAVKLGTALQLVNILRDLHSDARRGRVYLPQEELERFGVQAEQLAQGPYSAPFARLMSFQCERALRYFESARRLLPPEDRRSMVAAEIMAAIYWRLLQLIRQRGYNVFGERVRLSRSVKLWTAFSVYLGAEWHK
jgi:15-cis-phytoene synthase